MKVSELKHPPKTLPCCKTCENYGGKWEKCIKPLCIDLKIHNDLFEEG